MPPPPVGQWRPSPGSADEIGRPRHRIRPRQHHQVRPAVGGGGGGGGGGGLVNLEGVVRSIGIDLGDRVID